jgi:poly-beta-1,6-N-acetyl-D-glucosamine synthase
MASAEDENEGDDRTMADGGGTNAYGGGARLDDSGEGKHAEAPITEVCELLGHGSANGGQPERGAEGASALSCSVGIMAYNEEGNIANAIDTILRQPVTAGQITELIVVASGCTDGTAAIVADIAQDDPRVRLILQEGREGKASAINLFIDAAHSPVLLMASADVLVREGTIDALLRQFQNPAVGMVGGHPIPVNDETTFLGYAVHLLWRLHHRLARQSPKLGEIVAFRNVVPSIPLDTAVDEISIQALITQLGYQVVYEPQAVVYNRGPTTVGDFLRQRRRIYAGHLRVRRQQGYAASTMSVWRIVRALLGSGSFVTPRAAFWTVCTMGLEAIARGLGRYDFMRRQPHHVWQTATTTKRQIAEGANAHSQQNVLVFHIVNFHRQQLELGVHASRQVTQRVMQHIQQALGSNAIASVQRNGTVIALLSGDREDAERAARQLVDGLEATPLPVNGHRNGASVKLACGIIAFSQAGQALVGSIPAPVQVVAPGADERDGVNLGILSERAAEAV